jgi:hypothetical protein
MREFGQNTVETDRPQIKTDIKEVGCGGLDWTELAQVRDSRRAPVDTVMNLRVP